MYSINVYGSRNQFLHVMSCCSPVKIIIFAGYSQVAQRMILIHITLNACTCSPPWGTLIRALPLFSALQSPSCQKFRRCSNVARVCSFNSWDLWLPLVTLVLSLNLYSLFSFVIFIFPRLWFLLFCFLFFSMFFSPLFTIAFCVKVSLSLSPNLFSSFYR